MSTTHDTIINRWPSISDFADDLGIQYGTAKAMRRRKAIPARYWPSVVAAARKRRISGVTLNSLLAAVAMEAA